eukprot:366447-Chlamydomonas_euryale.AAC.5
MQDLIQATKRGLDAASHAGHGKRLGCSISYRPWKEAWMQHLIQATERGLDAASHSGHGKRHTMCRGKLYQV